MVDQTTYDAVLMDIQMPDMDGYQATAIIREKTPHVNLPIIAMTAHAMAGYREHCIARGINDYLSKPIEPDLLYEVLAKWTRRTFPPAPPAAVPAYEGDSTVAVAGIDMAGALSRLGGNSQLLAHLLSIFAEDFAPCLQQVRASIDAGQYDSAALLVHRIRGAAGNLSANDLYRSAGELEKLLMSGSTDQLEDRFQAFGFDFNTMLRSARAHASDTVPAGLQN
jgi:HPt (histidine-containing phosphotransfer) domain-containing protein